MQDTFPFIIVKGNFGLDKNKWMKEIFPYCPCIVLMITVCFCSGNYVTDDVCTFQVLAEQHEKNSIEDRLSSEIDQLRLVRECV